MVKKKEIVIDKGMSFTEILSLAPELEKILLKSGMHCIGCPMAAQETLEQGSLMHGINPDELVKELNKQLKKK